MKIKNLSFLLKISSSAGFTNIAVLIGLALFLLPALKLTLNNSFKQIQNKTQIQRIASDPINCNSFTPATCPENTCFKAQHNNNQIDLTCEDITKKGVLCGDNVYCYTGSACELIANGSICEPCGDVTSISTCNGSVGCFWHKSDNGVDDKCVYGNRGENCGAGNFCGTDEVCISLVYNSNHVCVKRNTQTNGQSCTNKTFFPKAEPQACSSDTECKSSAIDKFTCQYITATPRAGAATATPTPTPYVLSTPGYCSNGNGVNANPHWALPNTTITCNFAATQWANDANADAYCASHFANTGRFYKCPPLSTGTPAAGGSGATIICDGHGGVDGSNFPNGYVAPICTNTTPTKDNWSTFVFNAGKAQRQEYKDYKNYDVFLCTDNSYDFAPKPPKPGNSDICNKYPWTQDASGALPTNPPGHSCPDRDKPFWDGSKCTFRPTACNRTGWTGKENICQATDCANGSSPDIQPGENKTEANLACTSDRGQTSYCCLKTAANPGGATQTPTATPAAGSATATPTSAPNGGGTGTEYSHCYHGDSNNECDSHYKCNNPNGGASAYCVYKNPSEPNAYCQSGANHCETGSRCTTNQNGLHMGDTYACQRANLGTICCTGAAGSGSQPANPTATPVQQSQQPATSGCPGGSGTAYPNSVCQTSSSCPTGTHHQSTANDLACGAGQTCCIDNNYTGSTASIGQVVTACTTNIQCVNSHQGNACVFYGASSIGVCKTVQ